MAYFSQEQKTAITPAMKALLAQYGVKGTIRVVSKMKVVLALKSGKIDFNADANEDALFIQANGRRHDLHAGGDVYYHIERTFKEDSAARKFLEAAAKVLNRGNFDKSDVQTDYINVGHFVSITVGSYDKPYEVSN
jgi:hypothetical protein